ncbi:ankyrin [Trichoderma aethiopicum]
MRRLQRERLRLARLQSSSLDATFDDPATETNNDVPATELEDSFVKEDEVEEAMVPPAVEIETSDTRSTSEGYYTNTSELYVSEADYNTSTTVPLRVKIISINGLDGKHAWWGDSLSEMSLESSKFTFDTGLLLNEDFPAENIRNAASELLKFILDEIDQSEEYLAIVFIARDIGGTLLKQALLSAASSSDPDHERILRNTTHLLFFATPHRASEQLPWDYTISNLIYQRAQGTSSRWLPKVVRELAVFHEHLAAQFESFSRRDDFRYINYYQEESKLKHHRIVIPRYAATFGHGGERQIGREESHGTLANMSQPDIGRDFLSLLQDASAAINSEYREALSLLSSVDLEVLPPRKPRSTYTNLSNLILSTGILAKTNGLKDWGQSGPSSHIQSREGASTLGLEVGEHAEKISTRKPDAVSRSIQIVDLEQRGVDAAALASSLITSVLQKQPYSRYCFISLVSHPSRRVPATKLQLLATLARHLLTHYPRIFRRIRQVFQDVKESLRTSNTSWKEISLERLTQSLLRYHGTDPPFILILQPYDRKNGSPVQGLASTMLSWVKHTENHAKILLVQYLRSQSSRLDIAAATDMTEEGLKQQVALQKDHEAEFRHIIESSPRLSLFRDDLLKVLGEMHIMTPSQWIPILENHLFTPFPPFNILDRASKDDRSFTDLILESVTESSHPWIKTCLRWIVHSLRPLTYTEFQAILTYESVLSVHGDRTSIIVEEFRKLLPGVVETDGNVIYIARSEIVAPLTARLLQQRDQRHRIVKTNDPQSGALAHTTCNFDLYIAKYCVQILREGFENEVTSETTSSDSVHGISEAVEDNESDNTAPKEKMGERVPSPMLSYAAQNWLVHAQLWIDGSETPNQRSLEKTELEFMTDFIQDHRLLNWWLRQRKPPRGKHADPEYEYNMLEIAKVLGLDPRTRQGALKLGVTVQHASDNEQQKTTESTQSPLASTFMTLIQKGDSNALDHLDDALLEDLLPGMFQTGSGAALCHLASNQREFVRRNWKTVMSNAIKIGNMELFSIEGGCGDGHFEPSLWLRIAEYGSFLPENALDSLRSISAEERREIAHLAAASGHTDLIGKLIEAGFHMSQETSPGLTPLFLAAQHGHYTVASQLLAAKADTSIRSTRESQSTPLHAASASGYVDLVGLLLEHGDTAVDLSAQDRGGNTALHLALANDHVEVAASLLTAYEKLVASATTLENVSSGPVTSTLRIPSLDVQNLNLQTPLISAVQSCNVEVIKRLLHYGVNVNLADRKGKTALHYAAALKVPEILSLLLEVSGANLNAEDHNGTTPLHEASLQGRPLNVEKLLQGKVEYTKLDKDGHSPLELASEAGHTVTARALLPLYDRAHITASFLKAVSANNVKMAELLMDAGADMNAVLSDTGLTALHIGASRSDARLVQALLLRKAELNPKDRYGQTPLHQAARYNAVDCLKLLVDAGADVNATDSSGVTALIAAAAQNHEHCVDILLAAPTKNSTSKGSDLDLDVILNASVTVLRKILERVSVEGGKWKVSDFELLRLLRQDVIATDALDTLLTFGMDHNRIVGPYGTMLHYAALLDKPELVSLLAKNGRACPGVVHEEHGTPLQIASWYAKPNSVSIVDTLLEAGVDAELGSQDVGSPLHAAARMPERLWYDSSVDSRYLAIAGAIIDHKPSTLDKEAGIYPTVLESAVRRGTVDMVQLILSKGPDLRIVAGTYGTPLHLAVAEGYWRETQLILDCGSRDLNTETPDQEGRLPVHMLPRNSYGDENDYNVLSGHETRHRGATDKLQRHMAHFCAGPGNDKILERVLTDDPDALEAVDVDGWTPLHWACRQKSAETIRILLDRNADKNSLTRRGWRPVDVATYHGFMQDPVFQSLLEPEDSTVSINSLTQDPADDPCDDEETVPVKSIPNSLGYGCDSCGCLIHGPRYRCDKCHEFDMCFKCFRHVRVLHYTSHIFQKFDDRNEEVSIIDPW